MSNTSGKHAEIGQPSDALPANERTEIAALLERAKRAIRERKNAPTLDVGGNIRIPQKSIIQQVQTKYRRAGVQEKDMPFVHMVPWAKAREYADETFQVELDEDGRPYTYQGDVAMSCSAEVQKARLATASKRHERKMQATHEEIKAMSPDSDIRAVAGRIDRDIALHDVPKDTGSSEE